MSEICGKCGADEDDHYVTWENGVPMVGSYQDAPNGRICSPHMIGEQIGKHLVIVPRAAYTKAIEEMVYSILQIEDWRKVLADLALHNCCDEVCVGPCSAKRAGDALKRYEVAEKRSYHCRKCGHAPDTHGQDCRCTNPVCLEIEAEQRRASKGLGK